MSLLAAFALASPAQAGQQLFRLAIYVNDGVTPEGALTGTNDIRRLTDDLDGLRLQQIFQNTDWSNPLAVGVTAGVDLRGVPAVLSFPANSSNLIVTLPFLGFVVTFDAGDRDGSLEEFEQWLTGELEVATASKDVLTAILQDLVAKSPVDPIAGNPGSLQSRMFEAAFYTATSDLFRPKPGTPAEAEWRGEDLFRTTANFEHFEAGPWSGDVLEVGLDYQMNFRNPKWAVLLDLPFVFSRTERSESYLVSAGVGVQYRPTHWWNITPSFRIGGAGSFKLGAVAIMPNVNLTSSMKWSFGANELSIGGRTVDTPPFELAIGNMFGWNGTFDDLSIAGIRIAYRLNNYVLRNGIDLTYRFPAQFLGASPAVSVFFVDTWIPGSDLYLQHYNELGVRIGTQRRTGGVWRDALNFDVGWAFGREYDSVRLRLSYRF